MNPEQNLPLGEATFFILLSLTSVPRHGYGIMKTVEEMSTGRLQLSTGTLYGALKRMLAQGWIERYEAADDNDNGRIRKTYRLTDIGRRILDAEISRMDALVTTARQISGGVA
ncbi:MAG: PadR family transcriptional regulator [Ardenticatenaceae bacterium]|nr:MAG: PadR family transcriptional regulator [Ardenticatenaceae bacterium]